MRRYHCELLRCFFARGVCGEKGYIFPGCVSSLFQIFCDKIHFCLKKFCGTKYENKDNKK